MSLETGKDIMISKVHVNIDFHALTKKYYLNQIKPILLYSSIMELEPSSFVTELLGFKEYIWLEY